MDYDLYRAVNDFVWEHSWLGRGLESVEAWSVVAYAVATFGLWLLARPGGDRRWKISAASAVASAGVALFVNQVISRSWARERPFAEHPSAHVFGSRSTDPSFPSDHASAAFAIAFAVFLYDRTVGSIFLAAASVVAVGRVVVGVHYPADVLAGALVGVGVALVVVRLARPLIERLVTLVERISDPVLGPLWRRAR